jgi:pyruvate formate lyase activating enzyme
MRRDVAARQMTSSAESSSAGGAQSRGTPHGTVPDLSSVTGRVHSWDLSTGVDGPGARFVVFTTGCPLRCLYCENPDTWNVRGGVETTVGEVLDRVRRFAPSLRATGGGVTVTGGEPLFQPEFTGALLRAAKDEGLGTALDTSGFLGANASDALLTDTDLVLLDIKSFDPALCRRVTGAELAPTLRFAERLAALRRPTWVRFVLVPGLTDPAGNVAGLADFVAGLPNVERVDVLAYHRLGVPKYAALGMRYRLEGTPEPDEEQLRRVRDVFAERGLQVT